jgi:hypothetical protein
MMNDLNDQYRAARTASLPRLELALGGFATLCFWLAWLRSSEGFGHAWQDLRVVEPLDGPSMDLSPGCGVGLLRLAPETKSACTYRADVVVAYETLSGYKFGLWFLRAHHKSDLGPKWRSTPTLVFRNPNNTPWTSFFFRQRFLYPALYAQQAAGDAYLTPFDGKTPGNSLEAKFWSLHCTRSGARPQATRGGRYSTGRFWKATKPQVYEHGRWHLRRSAEDIDIIYRQWTLFERIQLTLYCR